MKKILFGITSLTLGGAERVLVDLANELSKTYEVTIVTLYGKGELEEQLNNKIKIKSYMPVAYSELSKIQKHILLPLKVLLFKKNIYHKLIQENYDIEIAFLEGPITRLLSTKNENTKKTAWIHNDISKVFGSGIKAKVKRKIDENTYSKYQKLVFVSKDNLECFEKTYPSIKSKKQVIYNYIKPERILKKSEEKIEEKFNKSITNFVTVARLVPQKAIDRLIEVHSKLIKEGLLHNIYVIGDGPEREKLEKMIKDKNIEKTFFLCGKKENPYTYMKQADYFCLFSYFEGYGMVLEEAKILNKPILITDTAAREAVEGYQNARIVENTEEGIYRLLKQILKKQEKQQEQILQNKYENENIIEQIKKLIEG